MIEIWMGHQISKHKPQPVGPYRYWHLDPSSLKRKFEECKEYKRITQLRRLKDAACSDHRYILLTVDDGFGGFTEEVLPLLEHYQIGCIIFLTTGFIDTKLKPYESELARIVNTYDTIKWPEETIGKVSRWLSKQELYEQLRLSLKSESNHERQDFIRSLSRCNPTPDTGTEPRLFLTWDEIQALDRHPLVMIGAHSETHCLLSAISWREAYREIRNSKKRIESKLGHRLDCFSYPYGGYSLPVTAMVRMAGFRFAFTTEHRIATSQRFNPLMIPRLDLQRRAPLSTYDN